MTQRPSVFLDTSGLFAAAKHGAAGTDEPVRRALDGLLASRTRLVTSDLVVAEFHGLTLGRFGPAVALGATRLLLQTPRVEIEATGADRLQAGLTFLAARPGRRLSMADAVSMLLMREHSIETAFTLDEDFRAEGFATIPDLGS